MSICQRLQDFVTSRHRDFKTSRHQDFETSRLRDFVTSRHRDFKTSRHRDFYSKLYTVNLKKRSTKTFVLSPYLLSPYLLKTIHAFTTHITLGAMPVRVDKRWKVEKSKSRKAKKSKSRKVEKSKNFVNYDLWSQCLLTRKHCPKQQGRYPGFHAPSDTFSDLVSVQWYTAGGVSLVIYSCATAHDLHVIPS